MSKDNVSINKIIDSWHSGLGGRVGIDRRLEHLTDLFNTIKYYGHDNEDILNSHVKAIVERCVNPNYKNKKKLQNWRDAVRHDLEKARDAIFGGVEIVKATEEQYNRAKAYRENKFDEPTQEEFERMGKPIDRSIFKDEPHADFEIDKEYCEELGISDEDINGRK